MLAALIAALVAAAGPGDGGRGTRDILLSANDGKQLQAGEAVASRTVDAVSVLEVSGGSVRAIATVATPTSMIGPPKSIVMTPDGRHALVTASLRVDETAADASLVPDSAVSVIDLSDPSRPRLQQSVQAGQGASGVAVNPAGTLVLVANAAADSVSVFGLSDGRLSPLATVSLDAGSKPVAVEFTPDGRHALVVCQNSGTIVRLAVSGADGVRADGVIAVGGSPYSLAMSRDGRTAFVTNLAGRPPAPELARPAGPRIGTVVAVDIAEGGIAQVIDVGVTPEHVALSPSGRFLVVVLINGSNARPDAPGYRDHGLLTVLAVDEGRLSPVAQASTGRWCQGAGWSSDESAVLLQCAEMKQVEVYRFDGTALTRDPAATLSLDARPGAMAGPVRR